MKLESTSTGTYRNCGGELIKFSFLKPALLSIKMNEVMHFFVSCIECIGSILFLLCPVS